MLQRFITVFLNCWDPFPEMMHHLLSTIQWEKQTTLIYANLKVPISKYRTVNNEERYIQGTFCLLSPATDVWNPLWCPHVFIASGELSVIIEFSFVKPALTANVYLKVPSGGLDY